MKGRNLRFSAFSLIIVAFSTITLAGKNQIRVPDKPLTEEVVRKSCLNKQELALTVQEFSSRPSYSELEQAKLRLLDNAKLSAQCRVRVIAALIEAMDKRELDVYRDFHLWRYGSELLADLKATEGLDLLIEHLSFTDGMSINTTHYPAMIGLIKIGRPAIAKLGVALHQNSDRDYRRDAVFCIAQIGGPTAVRVLRTALSSEQDSCVRKFIQVSIDALNNPKAPGKISVQDRDKWFAAFSCSE